MTRQKRSFARLLPGSPGIAVFLAALACPGLASASTAAAWSAHEQQVIQTCLKASSLKHARAGARPMAFDDRSAITALLVAGRYPQAHMKNQSGRELCLYNRKTRKAVVTPADQLSATAPTAPSRK
ncbi:MAG: hypothetical protein JWR74_465 [Polaromonas sp.]|nr:hypothetical protein [Polaromonas sp.]